MNLFAEQEQRYSCREWTRGHREGRGGWDEFEDWDNIYTLPRVTEIAVVTRYKAQEALWCSVLTQSAGMGMEGEGGGESGRGYMYAYD